MGNLCLSRWFITVEFIFLRNEVGTHCSLEKLPISWWIQPHIISAHSFFNRIYSPIRIRISVWNLCNDEQARSGPISILSTGETRGIVERLSCGQLSFIKESGPVKERGGGGERRKKKEEKRKEKKKRRGRNNYARALVEESHWLLISKTEQNGR